MMWKEKYKVGVKLIDEQHEELFHRVEDFIKSVRSDGDWEDKLVKIKETLEFMKAYVVTHFNDEEEYQQKINYPDHEAHKEVHERFKAEVGKYGAKLEENDYDEKLVMEFSGKLMAWLINHVAVSDQKIGDFVKSQGGDTNES